MPHAGDAESSRDREKEGEGKKNQRKVIEHSI